MSKTISVIMPVYNTEEFLNKSIRSILNQTYKDLELIILNDGSNDESKCIIDEMAALDKRIKVFHFDQRTGVGSSRNFGVRKSIGEYIYFFDSDDYLPKRTLELLYENIGAHDVIRGRMKSTNLSNSFVILFDGLFKVKNFTEKKYNLLKDNSAVNFLFRKQFIKEHKLSFDESVEVYSDLNFMVPALINLESVPYLKEAIYFRRHRNDPVLNPSLNQYDGEIKLLNFLYTYNKLKSEYQDSYANDFLDKQLLNIYRKDIIAFFKDNDSNIDVLYNELVRAIKKVNVDKIDGSKWILKKEIKVLQNKNIDKYKKINSRHSFLRDIREGFKSKRKFLILLHKRFFSKLPMKKDLVFFESFLGKSYSDNPKYIYEHMINNKMPYRYVWCFREDKNIPGNAIQVKRFSLRYFYYLARSKYWVSNIRLPKYLVKRKENIYLQTWHGTPLKTLVLDQKDIYSADPNYKYNFYIQSRRWDFLNSPNQYSSDIFRTAFKYDKKMLEFGYPRNDILYQRNTKSEIEKLKSSLGLPVDKKVILYAPTWRDDEFFSRGNYKFTLKLELDKLERELSDDYVVLLRTHYHIANRLDVSEFEGFVYDFSLYEDIAELYLVSDILITDYSSVFFDYANLKRPILFYTYDLENYRDKLRGFYINIEEEVPGPLLMTTNDVINAVVNIDDVSIEYKDKYEEFYNKYCEWDDGKASERTVKSVFK